MIHEIFIKDCDNCRFDPFSKEGLKTARVSIVDDVLYIDIGSSHEEARKGESYRDKFKARASISLYAKDLCYAIEALHRSWSDDEKRRGGKDHE